MSHTTTVLGLAVAHVTNAQQQIERAERAILEVHHGDASLAPESWLGALKDARMALENITDGVLAAYGASGEQDAAASAAVSGYDMGYKAYLAGMAKPPEARAARGWENAEHVHDGKPLPAEAQRAYRAQIANGA